MLCTLWLMLYRSCYGSIVPRGETRSPAPTTMNGSRVHANSALRHTALRRSQKGQTEGSPQTNANLEGELHSITTLNLNHSKHF